MIPIRIEASKLEKIKQEYLEKVNCILIGNKIKIAAKRIQRKDEIHNQINTELKKIGIKLTFEEILVSDYETLRKIKNQLDSVGCVYKKYENNKDKDTKQKTLDHECVKNSVYDIIYRKYDKLDKSWLINKIGVTVCPYCNREFINNRGTSTSAQLDHFYPRSKYPIFALSIFNLIPSCYACNHIKREQEIDISPYDNNINFDYMVNFTYTPLSSDYLDDHTQLIINMNYRDEILKNIKNMKIDLAYELHTDYVQELIKKAIIYNKEQIQEFLQNYNDIFSTDEEILRMIFGNYLYIEDLEKRPLAKLTKDILEELGIHLT